MKERLGKVKPDFWFFTKFFVIAAMCLFIVYPFYTILTKSVFSNKVEGQNDTDSSGVAPNGLFRVRKAKDKVCCHI